MAILESHRDSDFTVDTFDSFLDYLDLSFPDDKKGMHVVPSWHPFPSTTTTWEYEEEREEEQDDDDFFDANDSQEWVWHSGFTTSTTTFHDSSSSSWITPEHTPGGAFLYGLTFCGIDRSGSNDCSIKNSNAYWKYWEAMYGRFASNARGNVQITVSRQGDDESINADHHGEFIQRSIVDKLDPTQVDNVAMYSANCSTPMMHSLQASLQTAGIQRVTCSDDPIEFMVCALADPNSIHCQTYRNSCMYQQQHQHQHQHIEQEEAETPVAVNNATALNEDAPPTTNKDAVMSTNTIHVVNDHHFSSANHHHGILVLLSALLVLVGMGILVRYRQANFGEGGDGARSFWARTAFDKLSDFTVSSTSTISTNSRRRRREQAVQESTALLEEVNRNLFLNPTTGDHHSGQESSARDMETVILQ